MSDFKSLNQGLPLDLSRFESIKELEFKPAHNMTGLKLLREKAKGERDLRELYRGRAPYELLQNADDARAEKVRFILTPDGLVFAHDGPWFTVANFRSLADGWSDKAPDECIGHKGLGFRSVLDITPAPHVVRLDVQDFFGIKFSWAINNGHIQETFQKKPELREYYVSWTKGGQSACPVMAIPSVAKRQGLLAGTVVYDSLRSGEYGRGLTTMFWMPSSDEGTPSRVLEELGTVSMSERTLVDFLTKEVSGLLPFLAHVKEVKVYRLKRLLGSVVLTNERGARDGVVSVKTDAGATSRTRSFYQMTAKAWIPPEIHKDPQTPKAVRAMREATITLSVPLKDGQPAADDGARFHVYFPTEEATGVGFTIHGDFYVKPDRTRLMEGRYNDWLFDRVAKKAANDFLGALLERYDLLAVFRAIAPTPSPSAGTSAANFVRKFASELRARKTPYVPSRSGLLKAEEVLLTPQPGDARFWASHFSEVVGDVIPGKREFVSPEVDEFRTRKLFALAGLETLQPSHLLDFVKVAGASGCPMPWWYECYEAIYNNADLFRKDRSYFVGRAVIPTSDGVVVEVSDAGGVINCMPPRGDAARLHVPASFAKSFRLVNPELAHLLREGKGSVRDFALDRFGISQFEASDLLPRAVRSVVSHMYNGSLAVGEEELRSVWDFVLRVVRSSKKLEEESFWLDLGRLPLPLYGFSKVEKLAPRELVPAFLTYWPDEFLPDGNCLKGVAGLRRCDNNFLDSLFSWSDIPPGEWRSFLFRVGVSDSPKTLYFSSLVADGAKLFLTSETQGWTGASRFTGERQRDQNQAVAANLVAEGTWPSLVRDHCACPTHGGVMTLQSLSLVEGLKQVADKAEEEFRAGDEGWQRRLWGLLKGTQWQPSTSAKRDAIACRSGGSGGHQIPLASYLQRQMAEYAIFPTSQGPVHKDECFMRHPEARLISAGAGGDEIGDKLLPYVILDDIEVEYALRQLGVEKLEEASSATDAALVRALGVLSSKLTTEWGKSEILGERGRWRRVRGAIQDIYRALNQRLVGAKTAINFPENVAFAAREGSSVAFKRPPLFFARAGSPIERAFKDVLPFFDADRPYASLFEAIGVIQLISDYTVVEELTEVENSSPATALLKQVQQSISPWLLAHVYAQSGKDDCERAMRRVNERLDIRAAASLTVTFFLLPDRAIKRSIESPSVYLQRRVRAGVGGRPEAHFKLYVRGGASVKLDAVDADALGEALAAVFEDNPGAETQGLFARIVSKYKSVDGNKEEVREFLYSHLSIPLEAQEAARASVTGEDVSEEPLPLPPPPVLIRSPAKLNSEAAGEGAVPSLGDDVERHKELLTEKASQLVEKLLDGAAALKPSGGSTTAFRQKSSRQTAAAITPEQQARGDEGEKEILRRLQYPSGWGGFTLIKDVRAEGCGYDFLCSKGGREVRLEVKTFIKSGRLIITGKELQVALESKDDYYLIGVVDDEGPASEWQTYCMPNPGPSLLKDGEFEIEAKLTVRAASIFDL